MASLPPETEIIELDDEEPDVIDTPDGGAIVRMGEDTAPGRGPFYDNLADGEIDQTELDRLGSLLLDLIFKDAEDRKKRDEQYADGLRRTGLGDDAPGGAQFSGASKVVDPMLIKGTVDFAARAMKELFPPGGPVKDYIPGQATKEKLQKASRKTAFMNWQLTVQCKDFRSELEQLLTQVGLGGSQYLKTMWDHKRNRPDFQTVWVDDLLLPFAATNFYTAQRRTHVQYLTTLEMDERIRSGMYIDVDLTPPSMAPDETRSGKANNKIEGRQESGFNQDGLRTVFEVYATLRIEAIDDDPLPYIITVDKTTSRVLSVYRNWEEDDEGRAELQWFVEWPFVPWRGAYSIGLSHMIGGLSAAATGALRALLDSAHLANIPTGLKLKSPMGGQSLPLQPTQIQEVEGSVGGEADIRKMFMPLPFNPPSMVLFELLGFLDNAGASVVRTTLDDLPDATNDAPVGTTLARLEQGMIVYSAIHARLHDAMARTLANLHRLNGAYLDDEDIDAELGEELATRSDFEGPMDVVPVSDPNIFSEAQRFAQVQAVAQRADLKPQLYRPMAVERRVLETLKVPNPDELLVPEIEPKEQNAVNENVAASLGRPIVAFPEQDHIAHLATHVTYMQSPVLGMNPLIAPSFLPIVLGHIREHIAFWYAAQVHETAERESGQDVGEMMRENKAPETRREFDRMLAEASTSVLQIAPELFEALGPIIGQAQQALQQMQPPMPQDPNMVLAQATMEDVRGKAEVGKGKLQLEGQKLAQDAAQDQSEDALRARDLEVRQATDAMKLAGQERMNDADNATAKELAMLRAATPMNPNPGP